jgi:hypothetical protein
MEFINSPLSERIKILLPYFSACNVLITGRDLLTTGLHYDEVNMFVPIIIIREQGLPPDLLKRLPQKAEFLCTRMIFWQRIFLITANWAKRSLNSAAGKSLLLLAEPAQKAAVDVSLCP